MSSISGIFDPMDTTGKQSRAAAKKVAIANEKAAETQRQSVERARGELFELFPAAQQNILSGFQGAMDIFGQSLPAQTQAYQQGNVGAQQQLLAGLPMQQAAILGGQIDYSGLQPTVVNPGDTSFFNQQLPQYVDPYAPPTNADMGQTMLPPNEPFVGPLSGTADVGMPNFYKSYMRGRN